MSEMMPDTEVVAEEFEPTEVTDPEEPETLDEEGGDAVDVGEANPVDVAEQRMPVVEDEDGYDRPD
jgi:hypothetical protein